MNNIFEFSLDNSDFENILKKAINALENKNISHGKDTIILALPNIEIPRYINIKNLGYKLIICTPNSLDNSILNKAYESDIEIILTPDVLSFDAVIDMASDMALEINNAYFLDVYSNNEIIKAFYNYGKENKNLFINYDMFIVPSYMSYLALGFYKCFNVLTDASFYLYGEKIIDIDDIPYIADLKSYVNNIDKQVILFK